MLYAVGLTESGNRGSLQPYAMNIGGKAYFGTSAADVIRRLGEAQASGVRLVDLGCMQINHHYHRAKFASLEAMIDPRQNVEYATIFLKELKAREGSWTLAVARYHAGPNNNPAQKQYVCRVIANMVASGFGQWTPGPRLSASRGLLQARRLRRRSGGRPRLVGILRGCAGDCRPLRHAERCGTGNGGADIPHPT